MTVRFVLEVHDSAADAVEHELHKSAYCFRRETELSREQAVPVMYYCLHDLDAHSAFSWKAGKCSCGNVRQPLYASPITSGAAVRMPERKPDIPKGIRITTAGEGYSRGWNDCIDAMSIPPAPAADEQSQPGIDEAYALALCLALSEVGYKKDELRDYDTDIGHMTRALKIARVNYENSI